MLISITIAFIEYLTCFILAVIIVMLNVPIIKIQLKDFNFKLILALRKTVFKKFESILVKTIDFDLLILFIDIFNIIKFFVIY